MTDSDGYEADRIATELITRWAVARDGGASASVALISVTPLIQEALQGPGADPFLVTLALIGQAGQLVQLLARAEQTSVEAVATRLRDTAALARLDEDVEGAPDDFR